MKVSDDFRERVALIAFEKRVPCHEDENTLRALPVFVENEIRALIDAACRAVEVPTIEAGIQIERDRCVAILSAAKELAKRNADYSLMEKLRDCLDAVKSGEVKK